MVYSHYTNDELARHLKVEPHNIELQLELLLRAESLFDQIDDKIQELQQDLKLTEEKLEESERHALDDSESWERDLNACNHKLEEAENKLSRMADILKEF